MEAPGVGPLAVETLKDLWLFSVTAPLLISAVVADTVSRAREPFLGVGNHGLNMARRSFRIALYGRQNLIPLLAICGNLLFFMALKA